MLEKKLIPDHTHCAQVAAACVFLSALDQPQQPLAHEPHKMRGHSSMPVLDEMQQSCGHLVQKRRKFGGG